MLTPEQIEESDREHRINQIANMVRELGWRFRGAPGKYVLRHVLGDRDRMPGSDEADLVAAVGRCFAAKLQDAGWKLTVVRAVPGNWWRAGFVEVA